jgi:hypothetical protein
MAIVAAPLAAQTDKPLVNPNIAADKELAALPHMSAALAQTIVSQRPFKTMVELNALLSTSSRNTARTSRSSSSAARSASTSTRPRWRDSSAT